MDRKYWEKIAPDYHEEIFDVLRNDKKRVIRSAIDRVASPTKTVIDAGCAIGKWLPVLSPAFKKVIAADISEKNLVIARKKYLHLVNVEYLRADMSGSRLQLPAADVVVCINAVLTDSLKKRNMFFHNLSLCLKKGGHLILVVPSLESWLLTRIIQHRWNIDMKLFDMKLPEKEAAKRYQDILDGNAEIDNVPTKHYLREELELLLNKEGLLIRDHQKIEYEWQTEFVKPPEWLKKPGPWDWMILAKKK
ncbi:MAG: class I SAM-dependent methyltransferase [Chitinophagaceae bacterium]|nr:class I SAM-dependent methyltransferase [Chitinophagaceae bacterium]